MLKMQNRPEQNVSKFERHCLSFLLLYCFFVVVAVVVAAAVVVDDDDDYADDVIAFGKLCFPST